MKEVFSQRLKSARLMRGYSMEDLSNRLDGLVSKQSISKYEQGRMMPNSQVLVGLSKALDLPIDYFFRPGIQVKPVTFRGESNLSAHALQQLIHITQDKMERYLQVEELLSLHYHFTNPLSRLKISTYEDVEKAVSLLRQKWMLGQHPILTVYGMLESVHIRLLEIDMGRDAPLGFSTRVNGSIPVIVINLSGNDTVERKRFTALHELAHLLLRFEPSVDKKSSERLCHRFAGAMLCPAEVGREELGLHRTAISLDEFISLKSLYGISVSALVHRAKDLNIISEAYYHHIYNETIHANPCEEDWGGYPIPEYTDRFERLLRRAALEQVVSMSRAAELANEKLGDFREKLQAL